jgi:AraC-like DNA-binding protein
LTDGNNGKGEKMGTDEYFSGNAGLAAQFGCTKSSWGSGIRYGLPPENGNSWIVDVNPVPGLVLTNAYFTLRQPVTRVYEIEQAGLYLCSLNRGDITIVERGKKPRCLEMGIHLLVNQGQPFKIVFGGEEPYRYTGAWIFADFIVKYLQDRKWEEPLTIADALTWPSHYYNTPEMTLAFEQLKFAVRNAMPPLLYLESKIIEILSLLLRSIEIKGYSERNKKEIRSNYVTYQNKKFLWQVKSELDKDVLAPPTIQQLANLAGMGTTRLRQLFKSYYKLTISEYVRRQKMNYALRLLSCDEMSIQNISTLLGYESHSKFTVAFKKVHGFTPRHYRQSLNL